MNFNSNYIKNNEKLKQINLIVEKMLNEKGTTKPYDFLFRRNSEAYPKTNHTTLKLPGIFKQVESPNLYTVNERNLEQDFVESILPDGGMVIQESILSIEHLSYLLTLDKIQIIYHYKTSTTAKYGKPCIPIIITNKDYKTDELICKINNDTFSIKIIYFSQEMIEKIINKISKKDYSKKELSEVEFLQLIHCLIFAQKDNAKKVIEKIAEIFVSIENIKQYHHLDLHLALKVMIKHHYTDENEKRRLLTMITQAMSDEELAKLPTYEYMVEEITELKNKVPELEKTLEEKNKTLEEKNKTLEEKNKTLEEKNKTLVEKDELIKKLKKRVSILEGK